MEEKKLPSYLFYQNSIHFIHHLHSVTNIKKAHNRRQRSIYWMDISGVHSHFSLPFSFLILLRQTSLGMSTTLYHYLNLLFLQVQSGSHFFTETAFIKVTGDLHVSKPKHVSESSPAWPFTSFWDYWPLFSFFLKIFIGV